MAAMTSLGQVPALAELALPIFEPDLDRWLDLCVLFPSSPAFSYGPDVHNLAYPASLETCV